MNLGELLLFILREIKVHFVFYLFMLTLAFLHKIDADSCPNYIVQYPDRH